MPTFKLKIVSGGQTGADRSALDWAIKKGIPHGGWCPKGRKAEDGVISRRYRLKETPYHAYIRRTEYNVLDSDGTVVFTINEQIRGGTKKTVEFAKKCSRPLLILYRNENSSGRPETLLRKFIQKNRIEILNVAGPRASDEPEIAAFVMAVLEKSRLS